MKNYLLLLVIFLLSCEKSDPKIENEEELITTLIYKLTPTTGSSVELVFRDLDGDGGNPPVVTVPQLAANMTYSGEIIILNEQFVPTSNIANEILDEANDHQFFFISSNGNATIVYKDSDSNGKPIGLKTSLKTGDPSTDKLTITLKHQPNKSAEGVSAGKIENAGGETDIQVEFNLVIK